METSKTFASLLTPAGRGAVATVAVEGAAARDYVTRCFRPLSGRTLTSYMPGTLVVGVFQNKNGAPEELVVGLVAEDRIEVHCHGGRAAVEAVLQTLSSQGCEVRNWQQRVEAEYDDPIAAEGWIALAAATTEQTAGILLEQIRGALRQELEHTLEDLQRAEFKRANDSLVKLIRRGRIGRHLTQPWRIVIAGQPNVGKSSLMNALVGYERAIVFDQPGTTRDLLSARTALHGWPIELIDTAGLRDSEDPLEAAGISKAQEALAKADLILAVFEAPAEWTSASQALLSQLAGLPYLTIYNKLDLGMAGRKEDRPPGVLVSARTQEGLATLAKALVDRLISEPIPPGTGIPFTLRQLAALEAASQALSNHDPASAMGWLHELIKGGQGRSLD